MDLKTKSIGLVLLEFKGLAHAGVLKFLEEQKIKPSQIAGTSAGSIVGHYMLGAKHLKKF
jgi:NTE family protein